MARLRRLSVLFALLCALVVSGCAASGGGGPSPTPLSQVELKYRLMSQFGPLQYCDPDSYPIGRPVTPAYITGRLSQIAASDASTYQAILSHYRMTPPLTQSQEAQVYADYKQLAAIQLTLDGDNYHFAYLAQKGGGGWEATRIEGAISASGSVSVQSRTSTVRNCPICLAAWTLIETPSGPVTVTELEPGMAVWTQDQAGHRVAGVLLEVGSLPAPPGHQVVHLVTSDGREVWVSPGHPTADGRRAGDLVAGDELDGSRVLTADRVPYTGRTYDLLPSGPTGIYWASGLPLLSTLYTKMSSGSTAETTKFGTSTTSLILRSTATEQIA